MGNAGAFGIHSGVQRHYGYTQILQDRQQQPTQTICTGHANVSAASREQDREFLSQGVKDYWKAQETSMYKSTIKDVKALKKTYKKSKKDGRYATKIAKNYAAKQLANSISYTSSAFHIG